MRNVVKEDRFSKVRRNGRMLKEIVVGVVCAVCCAMPVTVIAQAAGSGLAVEVVDMSADSQGVTIPLNRSVIVKTTDAISRTSIVNSNVVDVQPISAKELLLTGKAYGQTNVVLWGDDDTQYLLDVSVDLDLDALNDALRSIDPQSKAEAKAVLGNIILHGKVSSTDRAERMVELAELFVAAGAGESEAGTVQNHLDIAGEHQVRLRVTVAEVNRSATRQLGINGFLAGDDFGNGFLVNQLGGLNPSNIGAAADALVTDTIPFLTGEDGIPLSPTVPLSLGFPRVQMQLFINALADNSLLKILAEPNLVAISGETASFLAGGEFPIPVPQGLDKVTVEFKEFGVRLNFTPIVLGDQLIRLRVSPEVSELDFTNSVQVQGFVVPGLSTRSAATTVELGNGQTIAIAGLLNEDVRGIASRVPGVGDLPVLGALFRSVEFRRSLTELVILVTPEIVAPMGPDQVPPLPGSDLKDPNDWELYAMGWIEADSIRSKQRTGGVTERSPAVTSEPEKESLHGPWGHESMPK